MREKFIKFFFHIIKLNNTICRFFVIQENINHFSLKISPLPKRIKYTRGRRIEVRANKDHSIRPMFEISIRVAIKLPNIAVRGPR